MGWHLPSRPPLYISGTNWTGTASYLHIITSYPPAKRTVYFRSLNVLLMHRSVCKGGEPCVSKFLKTNRNAREQKIQQILFISQSLFVSFVPWSAGGVCCLLSAVCFPSRSVSSLMTSCFGWVSHQFQAHGDQLLYADGRVHLKMSYMCHFFK